MKPTSLRSTFTPGDDNGDLLVTLAGRVRELRRSRGWTRADLAERSGISLRFLARIESGDGNVSLLKLGALARALEVSPDELIVPAVRLPRLVALVGLRGAGKSTVGPLLAERLALPFIEMDARIKSASGLTLEELFELHGERYYRRLERETLEHILAEGRPAVIAAAGGVVNEPPTWEMLRRCATVVWLKAPPEVHWKRVIAQGDRRPMGDNPDAMAELRTMLAARESLYAQSDLTVDTSGVAPEAVARQVELGLRHVEH